MNWPDKEPLVSFIYTTRSTYSQVDQMGYVYYSRYLEYFEVARTEMIRSLGYSYRELENSGVMLPVVEANIRYHHPITYDQQINIKVSVFELPMVKLDTFYEVFTAEQESLCVKGKVTLCFMNAENRKPCRAPEAFLHQLKTKS